VTRVRPLPESNVLASLLSEVTSTMLGIPFAAAHGDERIELLCWRSAILPIGAEEVLQVALASDERGCAILGARMFQVELAEVDASMIDDTLRELVNMTAGMIKRAIGADMSLGLPRIVSESRPDGPLPADWRRVLLRAADGAVELVLFVSDPTRLGSNGKEKAA
jgi:hypothetical protein